MKVNVLMCSKKESKTVLRKWSNLIPRIRKNNPIVVSLDAKSGVLLKYIFSDKVEYAIVQN